MVINPPAAFNWRALGFSCASTTITGRQGDDRQRWRSALAPYLAGSLVRGHFPQKARRPMEAAPPVSRLLDPRPR